MELSKEDFSYLKTKIEENTNGLKCPMCGDAMELSPLLIQALSYDEDDKGISIPQHGMVNYLKLIHASCNRCKHTVFFSSLDYLRER